MANAQIRVLLRGGEESGLTRRYLPGDPVSGSVEVTPESDVNCKHLYVRLQWHTEGRGNRDVGVIATEDVFQGQLRASFPTAYEFWFTLPREPWSYAGHYITLVWEIAVEMDVPWSRNPRHSQAFVMAPPQPESVEREDPRCDVLLTDIGRFKVVTAAALIEFLPGLGMKEARRMLDGALPITLLENASQVKARAARNRMEAAGAKVLIRERVGLAETPSWRGSVLP